MAAVKAPERGPQAMVWRSAGLLAREARRSSR